MPNTPGRSQPDDSHKGESGASSFSHTSEDGGVRNDANIIQMPQSRADRLVPERLRSAIRAAGYKTDAEAEKTADVSKKTLSKWRNREGSPRADQLVKVCLTLRETPWYLFGWEQDRVALREIALKEVTRYFTASSALVIEKMAALDEEQQRELVARVESWIEGRDDRQRATDSDTGILVEPQATAEEREQLLDKVKPPVNARRGHAKKKTGGESPAKPSK